MTLRMRISMLPRRSSSRLEVANTGLPSRMKSLVSWSARSMASRPLRRPMFRNVRTSGTSKRERLPSSTLSIRGGF